MAAFRPGFLTLLAFACLTATKTAASSLILQARQSDVCGASDMTCFGNGQACGSECTCIDPFESGHGACVPSSCISQECKTDDDCCSTPLKFVCLIDPDFPINICAPTLPPGEVGT
ncbi:hypothetical protein VTO73DRAFT_12026 [Trametes versicolor]